MFNLPPINIPGMPNNQQGAPQNPQQAAAASVTANSKPSLLTLQNAMGGLMGYESGQAAAQGLLGDIMGAFAPAFNSMVGSGHQSLGMTPPQQEVIPVPQAPPETPITDQPPKDLTVDNGWGGVKTDFDAINWALQRGDITADEARWLMKWQQGDANGNTNFVDGGRGTRNWDYWKSDLTDRNKRIVDKFYNAVSGNWGEAPAGAQQKQKPPQQENLLGVDPAAIQAAAARYRGGMR